MHIRRIVVSLIVMAALAATASPARADTFLTAYMGTMFNGNFDGYDPGRKLHYGATLTAQGSSGLGFEVDFSYAPSFYTAADDGLFDFSSTGNLVTLMGNLVVGRSGGSVRPYASGGLGLMKSSLSSPLDLVKYDNNGFGMNVGGGVRAGAGSIGIAADVRYFRQISDLGHVLNLELGSLSFWRGSFGVVLGF